jgi:undecaprenyl-diphosphatase
MVKCELKFWFLCIFLALFSFNKLNAQGLDIRILESINGPKSGADGTWRFITNNANYFDAAVPVTMVVVGFASHDDALKMKAYETAGAMLITTGATYILKSVIRRNRPFVTHPDEIFVKVGNVHGSSYSFPSGHTSLAFATATSLSMSFPKWYVIAPSFLYASAVGYSRMYVGVHYPSDVLGGAILGAGTSYLTFKAQKWLSKKRHN